MDLSSKTIEELNALQAAIESEKEAAKVREMEGFVNLVAAVKAKAEALGLVVKDFFVEKKERAVKVYRNPATGEEFSGKGPRPDWIRQALEGIDPTDKKAVKAKINEFLVQ